MPKNMYLCPNDYHYHIRLLFTQSYSLFMLNRNMCWLVLSFMLPLSLEAQQKKITLSGFVEDRLSGEFLAGAAVMETSLKKGGSANKYGFFSITLPEGEYEFTGSYVGYAPQTFRVRLHRDTTIRLRLSTDMRLQEVQVSSSSSPVSSTEIGKHVIPIRQIKNRPALLGESDVLKSLQLLPGVNEGSGVATGFSVRGGSPEQTQMLLDGIPVYNVNHAFGYLSVFNGEALKDVTLLKSGIPARYGGRLSSVLDITMREGNNQRFAGHISLSPFAGSVTLEGPLKKEVASFMISARRTWLDLPLRLGLELSGSHYIIAYGFYDLNAKLNWKISDTDRLYVSFYAGDDAYVTRWEHNTGKYRFNWGNMTASGRWNRVWNSRMFSNITLFYSRFKYKNFYEYLFREENLAEKLTAYSVLEEVALKADFDYFPREKHHVRYGLMLATKYYAPEMSYYRYRDEDIHVKDSTHGNLRSAEAYLEDDWAITPRWKLNAGVRVTMLVAGKRQYYSVEPRVTLNHLIHEKLSLKVSWSRMQQPIHLLTNSSLAFKTDMWVPVTDRIKPGVSDLFAVGVYHQLPNRLEFSAEVYYNRLSRMIRYADGIHYIKRKDSSWQDNILSGKGRGYGIDLMLNKPFGRLSGWLSYSLSKSERSYDEIREGRWFPFEYDRRHKLNVVADYTLPEKEEHRFLRVFSLNFTFSSGNFTTMSEQEYVSMEVPGSTMLYWGDQWGSQEYLPMPNNIQLPAFHHLDIAFHLRNKRKRGSSWSFSIYNVYARQNPSFYFWKRQERGDTAKSHYRQVSLTPMIPSVSWSYSF